MPTTRKLADLFKAIAAENISDANTIATQVCRDEDRRGHRTSARILRTALNGSGTNYLAAKKLVGGSISEQSGSFLSTGLMRLQDPKQLAEVELPQSVRDELEMVAREWEYGAKLRDQGIVPRSKLLFHGPPGCGKSLTAQAFGTRLGLPVYMVRFDAVIGAFLGQTAIHLRQLFGVLQPH